MNIIPIADSPGIAVILPQPNAEAFDKWIRVRGWRMKKWNYYHPERKEYKTFDELHAEFFNSRTQKEVAI